MEDTGAGVDDTGAGSDDTGAGAGVEDTGAGADEDAGAGVGAGAGAGVLQATKANITARDMTVSSTFFIINLHNTLFNKHYRKAVFCQYDEKLIMLKVKLHRIKLAISHRIIFSILYNVVD